MSGREWEDELDNIEPDAYTLLRMENELMSDYMENENMPTCDGCGDDVAELMTPADHWLTDAHYCYDCLSECDHCGNAYRYLSDHQDNYCDECNHYRCDEMEIYYCEECDHRTCEDCGQSCRYCNVSVHSYDWNPPEFLFKGNVHSQVTMGFELEIEGDDDDIVSAVHSVDDSEFHLYMKHDGSVDGVEIIGHPATLEWSRSFPFDAMLRNMRNAGCSVRPETNGLHIHISRDSFRRTRNAAVHRPGGRRRHLPPSPHALRWLLFLYRNVAALETLARRPGGRWAAFRTPDRGELVRKAGAPYGGDRYVAINCNNPHTYEMRFFASTLNSAEFWSALEFADASVEYTRAVPTNAIINSDGLSWNAFARWVEQNGTYPALQNALGI